MRIPRAAWGRRRLRSFVSPRPERLPPLLMTFGKIRSNYVRVLDASRYDLEIICELVRR